jgi:hypothetical protein
MKSRLLGLSLCLGLNAFANLHHDASAAPVLDQVIDLFPGGGGYFGSLDRAQTFTVGLAGQLTRVDVMLEIAGFGTPKDIFIDIRPTVNGIPRSLSDFSFVTG